MNFVQTTKKMYSKIKDFLKDEKLKQSNQLPENSYFLDSDILCLKRDIGDSRKPYQHNGYTLWAHSSGHLSINESTFYTLLPGLYGREPNIGFFIGTKNKDGSFTPFSILNTAKQPLEKDIVRYTLFAKSAVYYFIDTKKFIASLRIFVNELKEVCFSIALIPKTKEVIEFYFLPYINLLLKHDNGESIETNWFKSCEVLNDGFFFESVESLTRTTHIFSTALLKRNIDFNTYYTIESTSSKTVFNGGSHLPLNCSTSLFTGKLPKKIHKTKFTDTGAAIDIIRFVTNKDNPFRVDYKITVFKHRIDQSQKMSTTILDNEFDKWIIKNDLSLQKKYASDYYPKIKFGQSSDPKIKEQVLEGFVKNVIDQVEFAALSKNSGVFLLGVRDVFQHLEAALIWNPKECRMKILEALDFIDITGRPPRQYSLPPREGVIPRLDLNPYIDQGNWIINTIYQYLSYTEDYKFLDEICGYYDFSDGKVKFSSQKGTVLDHALRIMDYFIANIDPLTKCIRILFGDWNDAVDGLGVSLDKNIPYGTGVSVMVSLHFYQNINEMKEILKYVGGYDEVIQKYDKVSNDLKDGILKYAIDKNSQNERKILHGWGDKYSYKVGSFKDSDGANRDSLAVNAFFVLSSAIQWDLSMKDTILKAYKRLDSKYGLKTFEPFFPEDMKGVGRIINLPPGTAENGATYNHAAFFGTWSLFALNEANLGFEQLFKIIPITHQKLTTSTFIMPNSYSYNEEFNMDGESMNDWYTGSANALTKILIRYVIGVRPSINTVVFSKPNYLPFKEISCNLKVGNTTIIVKHTQTQSPNPSLYLNGVKTNFKLINNSFSVPKEFIRNEKHLQVEIL